MNICFKHVFIHKQSFNDGNNFIPIYCNSREFTDAKITMYNILKYMLLSKRYFNLYSSCFPVDFIS